jgi:glycosyltransferase involved in cell wall biosynthesis
MRKEEAPGDKRLLVCNCHEAWVYQLGVLGYQLDIIVGLNGRYTKGWDERIRPVPANSHLVSLEEAVWSQNHYYCIITHSITDLLDIKERPEPRLLVIHSTLEGRAIEERSNVTPYKMRDILHKYLELAGGHVVAVSLLKGRSWGFTEDIVPFGVDVDEYLPYRGETAAGLRVCNFIESRKNILSWDFYQKAFAEIPVQLVGYNPGMAGVRATDNRDHLKRLLQSHRFYIHTASPRLEDGYNMGCLEAMAAGLPVIGNRHPTSPIEHGVSGFLSDDPDELRRCAQMLLEDRDLAERMGQRARETVKERFSIKRFKEGFIRSIEIARQKWEGKRTMLRQL